MPIRLDPEIEGLLHEASAGLRSAKLRRAAFQDWRSPIGILGHPGSTPAPRLVQRHLLTKYKDDIAGILRDAARCIQVRATRESPRIYWRGSELARAREVATGTWKSRTERAIDLGARLDQIDMARACVAQAPDFSATDLELSNAAFRLLPSDDTRLMLAQGFLLRGSWSEARRWIDDILAHYPDRPKRYKALTLRGAVWAQTGDLEQAVTAYREASELEEPCAAAAFNWLVFAFMIGKGDETKRAAAAYEERCSTASPLDVLPGDLARSTVDSRELVARIGDRIGPHARKVADALA